MNREQIFLTRAYLPEYEEYIEEIKDLWESHWITSMGRKHDQFEKQLACFLNVNNVSVFTNGHNALEILIRAMNLSGEIITTPYTFVSTTHAIVRNGLTPVFCDIKSEDFTIDSSKIESLITSKTSAIVGVHVYGNPCDVFEIQSIAQKYNLKVIYDAAHAFGETYKGLNIAEYGDASVFSFHASKVFNSIEGGCVACNNSGINDILYKMRNFGINNQDVEYVGTNAKMNEFVAAMGLCNLRHFDKVIRARRELTDTYMKLLSDVPGVESVMGRCIDGLQRNYIYFPILVDEKYYSMNRDDLYYQLNERGVQALRHFYPLTSEFSCYNRLKSKNNTPVAKWVSEHILLLPLFADLQKVQVEYICDLIKKLNNSKG